ncbi:MAG: FKBP-type peptidyl-prolyl cis-trans isomerase [Nitrospirota bacterium]
MANAQYGDTVKVHYKASLSDGTVITNTYRRDPLQFTIGAGQVIQDFEKTVVGMDAGETKIATVPGERIFGEHRNENILELDKHSVHANGLEIGKRIKVPGQRYSVKIVDVSESTITVDANHPLADKNLYFDIHLVEIV